MRNKLGEETTAQLHWYAVSPYRALNDHPYHHLRPCPLAAAATTIEHDSDAALLLLLFNTSTSRWFRLEVTSTAQQEYR